MGLLGAALIVAALQIAKDSPHGEELDISCSECHTPEGWKLDEKHYSFDHNNTQFPLTGQHQTFDCRKCHETLVFSEAETECMSCHTDVHEQTVGMECERCHTSQSWLVHNITEIHQLSRFPLTGPHITATCNDCHKSASSLRFEPLGVECIDCHEADYLSATNPNHLENAYSTNCTDCHSMLAFTWTGAGIDHSFFPLTQGHDLTDCFQCHTQGTDYGTISDECSTCHEDDFNTTLNPNHQQAGFTLGCADCHTTSPGWKPANFFEHDVQFFPVYSGEHNGEWNSCVDCHTNPADYSIFSCTECHEHNQPDMDDEHKDVGGYIYESMACFECHPTGSSDEVFDHNASAFPLTGAHVGADCMNCHSNGFEGTPTDCFSCHESVFIESLNPAHNDLGLSEECAECHSTLPGWEPATFEIHNQYYALIGAHANIANDCSTCHNGNYIETPNTCVGCHQADYEQTSDPPHQTSGFGTACLDCHTQNEWEPATFDHDGMYFPIYSGEHNREWNTCLECHTDPGNFVVFSCIDCHEHNQADMDDEHNGVGGYLYESSACFECHPTGESSGAFNHNSSGFPLTGAHTTTSCLECHESGYQNTPSDCFACHEPNYNQSGNPNHINLALSNNCEDCHTTEPGWSPATFDIHNDYYVLQGAHLAIANNCADCHNGNYNSTPNTCFECHEDDFNQANDPPHQQAQFPEECELCHTQSAWEPSTFNHDAMYFPIYSGEHNREWNTCSDCHTNPTNYAIFSCFQCHSQPEMDDEHDDVSGYQYNSIACLECHPSGSQLFRMGTKPINYYIKD
jgi:hypothetical protein